MAQNQYLKVPVSMPDSSQHLRLISNTVNNTLDGKNMEYNVCHGALVHLESYPDSSSVANSVVIVAKSGYIIYNC